MKFNQGIILLFFFLIVSCAEQEARRPISKSKSYTLADTSEQLKKINRNEELKIEAYIKRDSLTEYNSSPNGYWYSYLNKVEGNGESPQSEDVVELLYEILDLKDQVIYSKEELGLKNYKIDKEDFIPALQLGIKEMKVGETIKFVIPSYNAFGVVGDEYKIGINQSIISIVTLLNINKKNEDN